ncbi:hypothetical protein [Glutamicibacter nicotianae]|uniref:hypothetical protein n=1 Tax=Glutamicibacter nicotianae TaxID=37929 RepID=UPI00167F9764|nr:hypothetical protein [Glutamicibacter nicotianae]
MNITAKELSGEHIGKTIGVPKERATISGVLEEFQWEVDIEEITNGLGEVLNRAVVSKEIRLNIGGYEIWLQDENTPITIQEGE